MDGVGPAPDAILDGIEAEAFADAPFGATLSGCPGVNRINSTKSVWV